MKPTKKQLTEAGFECRKWQDEDIFEPNPKKRITYFEEFYIGNGHIKLCYDFVNNIGEKHFYMQTRLDKIELKGVNTVAKAIEFWWMILGDKIN